MSIFTESELQINNFLELENLIKNIKSCEIAQKATNTVVGQGYFLKPKIFAIGEAPGQEEDKRGIPFCGRSGKLLTKIFTQLDLSRDTNLFVTNAVFWRPPNNRKPLQEEIEICGKYLNKMIELSQPKFILLIGATAFKAIFNKNCIFNEIRQKILIHQNIPTGVIYHPSYLLRQPNKIQSVIEDLEKFLKFIDENL